MASDASEMFMNEAIALSGKNLELMHGGPFGAVVVREGQVIGRGYNQVVLANDPTAHAEIMAIRDACRNIGSYQLDDCHIYSSCEPCPMCLGAIYWARPARLFYACTRHDAGLIGFDDHHFHQEMQRPESRRSIITSQIMRNRAFEIFQKWLEKSKTPAY